MTDLGLLLDGPRSTQAGTETSAGTCSSFSHAPQPLPLLLALSPLSCWTYALLATLRDGQQRQWQMRARLIQEGGNGKLGRCWQQPGWESLAMATAAWDTKGLRDKT